jgi:hypothetical protein
LHRLIRNCTQLFERHRSYASDFWLYAAH